jgi:hypothetical protein
MKNNITSKIMNIIYRFRKMIFILGCILIGFFILNIAGVYNKIFYFLINTNFSILMIGIGFLLITPDSYFSSQELKNSNNKKYHLYYDREWIITLFGAIFFITSAIINK